MPLPLQVDGTGTILSGLRLHLPGARCVTEFPADLEQALPVARVERVGGGDDGVLLDTGLYSIDCIDVGTETSRLFANDVIGAMYALLGATVNGAAFSYIRKDSGPIPLPYDNPAVRRQLVTFRVGLLAV